MEKINIAELLKDCPKGMELDCTMFDDVKFIRVEEADKPICIRTGDIYHYLTQFGTWTFDDNAKCVIFPKGKTTWEGFQRPFVDGDIILTHTTDFTWASIFKQFSGNGCCTYVDLCVNDNDLICAPRLCDVDEIKGQRLATKDEIEMLFRAIEDRGYKWNAETRTLEKLLKFKVGDRIKHKNSGVYCTLGEYSEGISAYRTSIGLSLTHKDSEHWELFPIPDKFDITTLIPFESKVLVRNDEGQYWIPAFWGCKRADGYATTFGWCKYCIPFEGNEYLLETNKDCDEHFKTWK